MELAEQLALIEIFEESAAYKRRKARSLEEANERAFEEHKQQKQHEKGAKEFFDDLVAATDRQIAAFRTHLDDYDTGVVHALMDNERALEEARKQREELESEAYKLPDGRMAFKTEDGRRVFDQTGTELFLDTIDPNAIPDTKPRWESLKALVETEQRLSRERQELHEFQKKVDDARDAVGKPDITAKELDDLDADLQRSMPEAVRQRLSGNTPAPDPAGPQISGPTQAARLPNAGMDLSR